MASHQIPSLLLATFLVLLRHCCADLGLLSWGALSADNATAAGSTLYGGDGTFYGQQGGQDDWGTYSYGSAVADTVDLEWHTGVQTTIALNADQFQDSLACGMCLYFRGTGAGIGNTPIPAAWQFAFVDNLCPECAFGSLDLDEDGDGRWKVEWFPGPCEVGNSSFTYVMGGATGNPYWFEFTVSNTRVPIAMLEMQSSGQWFRLRRAFNNMFAANGGPFDSWPIPIRITSVLNDTVYDSLPKTSGQGSAQFPDRGPAVFPKAGTAVQVSGDAIAPYAGAPAAAQPPAVAPAANGLAIAAFVVPNGGQCGGSGLYCRTLAPGQCKDAQWDACSCNTGYSCQRQNESWWQCQPVSPASSQQATTTSPLAPAPLQPQEALTPAPTPAAAFEDALDLLRSYTVPDGGQCGGDGIFCSMLEPAMCIDQAWDKSSCNPGFACTRHNASWWSCEAAQPSQRPTHPPPGQESAAVTAFSGPPEEGGSFTVVPRGQCGGNTLNCIKLGADQCIDGEWLGATCTGSAACTRYNAGWWQCDPASQDTANGRKLMFAT